MVLGVRAEPELEQQLDRLARQLGKSRSACIREAIRQYLIRPGRWRGSEMAIAASGSAGAAPLA
jgi:predicted transcriptional regulator